MRTTGVDFIVEAIIVDMDLVRVYPHNGTILTMKFLNLPEEFASFDDIVVELKEESESC
jgi:hypothetical protein